MKNIFLYCLIYLVLLLVPSITRAQHTDDLNLSAMIQPTDSSLFVRDVAYFNWCSSILRDSKGKYHLFYSRWPKSVGFYGWLTHSEIAHSEADFLLGPYRKKETVLQGRSGYWDAITAHNVKVEHFDGNYYMYYTSTNGGKEDISPSLLVDIAKTGYSHPYWTVLRENQRIGVAVSKTIHGKWKRQKTVMIEPSGPIQTVTVNPAIAKGLDGRYYLIVKGDATEGRRRLIQAIGVSNKPDGGFELCPKPAFSEIPTEDVSMWYDRTRERFYGIFHAHGGDFIGLITSADGVNWTKAKHYEVCKKQIQLKDGTVMKVDRMERPFVYVENGLPLLLALAVKRENDSFLVLYPLK